MLPGEATKMTIESVIEATVSDPIAYFHGESLRALLSYEKGEMGKLLVAAGCIRKLLEMEQRDQAAATARPPVLVRN